MLHNAVVLYQRTITFTHIVSTNHKSRLHIPTEVEVRVVEWDHLTLLDEAAVHDVVAEVGFQSQKLKRTTSRLGFNS